LSLYPSSQGFEPVDIPANWISRYTVSSTQPLLVTETGYGSVPFNGSFPAPGSEELQSDYVLWLMDQADQLDMEFLVWFFPSDIPNVTLPDVMLSPEFSANFEFFHYMGLAQENYTAKPAQALWDENVLRPLLQ
jgi:hypothetical protein